MIVGWCHGRHGLKGCGRRAMGRGRRVSGGGFAPALPTDRLRARTRVRPRRRDPSVVNEIEGATFGRSRHRLWSWSMTSPRHRGNRGCGLTLGITARARTLNRGRARRSGGERSTDCTIAARHRWLHRPSFTQSGGKSRIVRISLRAWGIAGALSGDVGVWQRAQWLHARWAPNLKAGVRRVRGR